MNRILLFIVLTMFTSLSWAQSIKSEIQLDSIQAIKTSEKYGDELYLVVTEINPNGDNKQYTIPKYPVTWPSEGIDQVKDIKLWSGDIQADSARDVIIELVERDAPPYNVDDSLGSIRIKISNKAGHLQTAWEQDWTEDGTHKLQKDVTNDKLISESYTFTGEEAEYKVTVSLSSNKAANVSHRTKI